MPSEESQRATFLSDQQATHRKFVKDLFPEDFSSPANDSQHQLDKQQQVNSHYDLCEKHQMAFVLFAYLLQHYLSSPSARAHGHSSSSWQCRPLLEDLRFHLQLSETS